MEVLSGYVDMFYFKVTVQQEAGFINNIITSLHVQDLFEMESFFVLE